MKKRLLFLCAGMLMLAGSAFARPVDANKARTVAETYLRAMGMKNTSALVDVTAQTPFTEFYIFAAEEGGFILVSADDCARPVLGYSTTSKFKTKNIPANVRWWLEGYEKEIRHGKSLATRRHGLVAQDGRLETARQWQQLLTGRIPEAPLTTAVATLMTTTWDQSPYYNNLCPYDATETSSGNSRMVTGCVATATSQIMKYHNHPTTGYGSHSYYHQNDDVSFGTLSANFGSTTYQWSNMPNALTGTSSTTQLNAVATLMYHVGVADEMDYNYSVNGGSGARNYYGDLVSTSSQESLARYFKYRPDMAAIEREFYDDATYCALLRGELDQNRPILYSGRDYAGGHSFVIDGYNNNGQFHVNWGWGGSNDGYYAMGALNPGEGGTGGNATYTFNSSNVALIGIRPNTSWSTTGNTTVTASMQSGSPSGSVATVYDPATGNTASSFSFGDTIEMMVSLPEGYRFNGWGDGSSYNPRQILATGGSYSFVGKAEFIGGGDTIGYCKGGPQSFSSYAGGVKLPASALDATKYLTSVMFYAYDPGQYDITVYTGSNHETTAATVSYTVTSDNAQEWQTVALPTPVAATGDLWIIISSDDDDVWPVVLASYCGVPSSTILVDNGNYYEYGSIWGVSAMVKGIFGSDSTNPVVSNCFITSFPYTENFDDTSTYSCLRIQDNNADGETWGLINNYGVGNSIAAYIQYAEEADDYLILPAIVTPGSYTFSWKAKAFHPNYPESYEVYVGNSMVFSETLSDTNYVTRTVSFTVAAGDTVSPMFRYVSDDMYYFFLDDITVTQGAPTQYTVTTLVNNPAWGSVTAGGTYTAGSSINLVAIPNNGYEFYKWVINGTDYQLGTDITVTVSVDVTAMACFKPIDATFDASNVVYWTGNGNRQAVVAVNWADTALAWGVRFSADSITVQSALDIIAANDSRFSYSSNSGNLMNVSFSENGNTLSGDINNNYWESLRNGIYDMGMSQTYLVNGDFEKLAESAAGTAYDSIYYDGYGWLYLNAYTMAIYAVDTPAVVNNDYTVTATANNSAYGSVTGSGTYSDGDYALLAATANSGYQFAYWSDGSIDNPHYLEVTSDTTIVAVFTTQRPAAVGDTVSYCDNDEFYTNMGAGGNIHWGIMLPASNLTGRNYLKSVMLYVAAQGTYNMNIYTGGTAAPGTLLHSQTVVFGEEQIGWQEILLDATCAINGQNLWVTFHNSGVNYPAVGCHYVGSTNSDWVSLNGTDWSHLAGDYGYNVTWMIKAVTSATQPTLPAPSVTVSGSVQVGVGATAYFSAIHTDGVTPSWTLTGATPATATGDTVMATWNVAGYYNVIATVSNTYGTTSDTLTIHVVDYGAGDTVSYVLDRPFLTKVGTGSSRAFSWGIMVPADYMANRRQVNKVLVGLKEPGSYSVRIFQGGDYAPQTLVYSDIFSITSADTAQTYFNYIPANPIAVSNNSNLWVVFHADNLDYPASTTHHTTEPNSDWTSFDDTNWYHLPQLGVNASWMIKVVTSADSVAPIELYTVTATANNPAWGTVTGSGTYTAGSSIALTATPNSGYHFAQWLDGSMQNPRIVTVSSDTSFVAVFEVDGTNPPTDDTCAITQFPYVMDFENGAPCWSLRDNNQNDTTWGIIGNYGYNGSTCAFAHYQLQADDWLMSPRVAMTGNYSVSWKVRAMHPSFPETYQVWAMGNDTSIMIFSETLSDTLYQDRMATFTVPAGDSVLIMWRYISADMYVLFLDNVTISQGTQQQFTVTATSNNPAWGTVTGGGTYPSGSTATLMAIANSGYHFVEWQDGNTQNPLTITVTSNATYTATFAADSPNPPTGDTISYCLSNPIATAINAGGAPFDWGIMFPASSLTGRNYLKSVVTYVLSDETYTLRVFRGGDNMPATLVHTQSVSFDTNHLGWQEIALDASVSLPTGQNLWVVLNSTVAAVCNYTGDVNSDWLGFSDSNWIHLYEANASLTYSWLLKAVTSATQPALPAPSVSISGPTQIAMGTAATFVATGTAGAVITWNFQGGTPAVATGTSATTTFTTPGLHNVVATITNAYGTGRDTLQVLVVDYAAGDTVSYCLDREFFTNIGTGSPAPFSWGIMLPAAYLVHRDKLDHVLLYTKVPGDYTLRLYQGGDTVPQNLIHTQVFNITDTNSGYKTLTPNTTINIDKTQNLWIVFHTDSLSYAAAAGAYVGDINSDWITLDDTNWNHLPDYGLVYSWLIKVVTSQEGPVTHNVTVVSIMNDGTEIDPTVCTVTGTDSYAEGSTVTLTATSSDPAIEFLFWITPSGDTILDNPYIFSIHSDVTLIAVFNHTEGISGIRNARCNIYPNPAHDFVVIDGVEGQAQVTITDITGRQVAGFEVRNERTEFDVSRLGAGQYFVRIVADGINTVKKLIVK